MKGYLVPTIMLALLLAGCAGGDAAEATKASEPAPTAATALPGNAVKAALLEIDPSTQVLRLRNIPIPGWKEVYLTRGGVDELVYVSDDGNLMIVGQLLDLKGKASLTTQSLLERRVQLIRKQSPGQTVKYVAAKPQQSIYVFTDSTCPVCQELHNEIPKLNAAGVTVEYLAFPRGGPEGDGFSEMTGIWCAKDRPSAFSDAISGELDGADGCGDIVSAQYELGLRLGVQGTPTIVTQDGLQYSGFPGTDRLLAELGLAVPVAQTASREDAQ